MSETKEIVLQDLETQLALSEIKRWGTYPEYEDSNVEWIGRIPKHWNIFRLKFLCTINPPKSTIKYVPADTEVSFLPMENIEENGTISLIETRKIEQVWRGFTYFQNGDVIVAKITPCFENGKTALCRDLLHDIGFGTTELHVLRTKTNLIPELLFYIIKSEPFRSIGTATMQGSAGQQRVSAEFISNFLVAIPPLPEQHVISTFLDRKTLQINTLIEKKERLIQLLQEKRTAIISNAVMKGLNAGVPMKDSGVEWLGEIPEHWSVRKIKFLSRIVSKGTTPTTIGEMFQNEGIRFIKAENIMNSVVIEEPTTHIDAYTHQLLKRSILKDQDVLVVIAGATTGKVGIITEQHLPANTNQAVAFIRLVDVRYARFLLYWLSSSELQRQIWLKAVQAAQPNLSLESVSNFVCPVPPIGEAMNITCYLDQKTARIDKLISRIREGIENLQEYSAALISAAVTGKIDVRG